MGRDAAKQLYWYGSRGCASFRREIQCHASEVLIASVVKALDRPESDVHEHGLEHQMIPTMLIELSGGPGAVVRYGLEYRRCVRSQAAPQKIGDIAIGGIQHQPSIKCALLADVSVPGKTIECRRFVLECSKGEQYAHSVADTPVLRLPTRDQACSSGLCCYIHR